MLTRKQIKFIENNRERMSAPQMAARLGVGRADVNEVIRRRADTPSARVFRMPPMSRLAKWGGVALILIAALIAYSNSFTGEFVFDNQYIITRNPHISDPKNAGKIWTEHYWAPAVWSNLYRPLTLYTYYINRHWLNCGDNPAGYHAVNLLIHAACGVLAFFFVSMLARAAAGGWLRERAWLIGLFAALLFVTHPVNTEAVANVVGRADLLVMMFLLAGLLAHMRASEAPTGGMGAVVLKVLAALCMALALLCKENAIAMIAIVVALDALFLRPRRQDKPALSLARFLLRRAATCYVFYFVVIGGWFLARYLVLREMPPALPGMTDNSLPYLPFLQREATAVVMLGIYLWRLVFPLTLAADYSYNAVPAVESAADWRLIASLAALLALGVLVVLTWRKSRFAAFMALWFFVTIAPVSNVFIITGTIGAERLLYVSSLFWCALLAAAALWLSGLFKIKENLRWAPPAALLGVIVLLYGVRTTARNPDWQNELTLWSANYLVYPASVRTADNYARALLTKDERGNAERCRQILEAAIPYAGDFTEAYATLARVYLELGDVEKEADRPETARRFYLDAHRVAREGEKYDVERQMRERETFARWGMKESDIAIGSKWEIDMALAHTGLRMAGLLPAGADGQKLDDLYDSAHRAYRRAVMARPQMATSNYELGELLLRRASALPAEDPRRKKFLEEAAVSFLRLMVAPAPERLGQDALKALRDCYVMLGHTGLVLWSETERRFGLAPDPKNKEYLRRAMKSFMMIQMVNKNYGDARELGVIAEEKFDATPGEVQRILNAAYSPEDEEIWYGGALP